MDKRRFVIIGTGVRGLCFARPLVTDEFRRTAELVALFDRNPQRMAGFNRILNAEVPTFTDFGRMVRQTQPTHGIICTPDATHDEFIARCFEHGLDAICEKPMATDDAKVRRILALERRFSRRVTVTFNYRFVPYVTKIKEVLRTGRIGRILSLSLDWHLDMLHGAEYFRRWHAQLENSGGLLVHKATHHFDLVNWFLEDEPARVSAFGDLLVYGRNGPVRGERCTTCPHYANGCRFAMVTHLDPETQSTYDNLYWNAESADGYLRDRCVYRPEIDIYDTMSAIVKYRGGAQLAYSLNAYSATEGYVLALVGTEGRLEARESHGGLNMRSEGDANTFCIITGGKRSNMKVEEIAVPIDHTNHGGGDSRLYRHLFAGDLDDPLNQMAGSRDGAMSCLIGIAANKSIAEGRPVAIADLLAEPVAANA